MRTDRVWLDPKTSRCHPMERCPQSAPCGRRLALIPKGAPLEDFSQAANQVGFCMRWMPTNLEPEKPAPQVKEWPT